MSDLIEKKNVKPKGFVPVMLTPFKENGVIDFDGLTALTEFYLSAGALGMFANCQSSEMYDLTSEERIAITKHVVKVVNGSVPVVAVGTFSRDLNEQAEFVKRIYNTGVEAVIAVTSILAEQEEPAAVFENNVFRLLEKTGDIPLGFYECPLPYKRIIFSDQLKKFIPTGRIAYLKECSHNIDSVRAKLDAAKGSNFGLYEACMEQAVASLNAGAAGFSCIQGNFVPELVVWLCNNYDNLKLLKEVNLVQDFFIDNLNAMENEDYKIVSRYYLQRRGINITTYSRTTRRDLNEKMKKAAVDLYERYEVIQDSIKLPKHFFPFVCPD
jgi:4-hydroxy-tetrahydrodipicolinate synthase